MINLEFVGIFLEPDFSHPLLYSFATLPFGLEAELNRIILHIVEFPFSLKGFAAQVREIQETWILPQEGKPALQNPQ